MVGHYQLNALSGYQILTKVLKIFYPIQTTGRNRINVTNDTPFIFAMYMEGTGIPSMF